MQIKTASSDSDIKQIAKLADIIWHEHFPSIISEEQINYMVKKFQSYEALKDAVENGGYKYYMAYLDGDFCAYLGFKCEDGKTIFISKVYVRADKRRKGIASAMLERLKNDYHDVKKWYLTVNKSNSGSIEMYERSGFKTVREQCSDIGSGFVMDDYIMEKTF